MSERDYGGEYREARSRPRTPIRSPARSRSPMSEASSTGRATPPVMGEVGTRSTSEGETGRSSRVGNIILQAAQQARQHEQAQATARTAAQIAAQARKMRGRSKRVMPAEEIPEADMYDMESGMRGLPIVDGEMDHSGPHDVDYSQPEKASPTAKDIRGQSTFTRDGKAYNLPLPPAFALLDINKPGRRSGQKSFLFSGPLAYRLCLWMAILVTVLSIILGISLLTAYLALEPRQPSYELDEIRIQWWSTYKDTTGQMSQSVVNGTVRPTVYLYTDAIMVIRSYNPNNKISLFYDNTTIEVYYQGVSLGNTTVPSLHQPPENSTLIQAEWKCSACPVLDVGHYLTADEDLGSVPLQIKMTVDARVEVGGVVSPGYAYTTTYDVKVTPPKSGVGAST